MSIDIVQHTAVLCLIIVVAALAGYFLVPLSQSSNIALFWVPIAFLAYLGIYYLAFRGKRRRAR